MLDHFWIGAQICQSIVNTMGIGKKRKLEDFLPIMEGKKRRKKSPEQIARSARAALGG